MYEWFNHMWALPKFIVALEFASSSCAMLIIHDNEIQFRYSSAQGQRIKVARYRQLVFFVRVSLSPPRWEIL
jgi:hypothetical protein